MFLDLFRFPGRCQCQVCGAVVWKSNRARHVRTTKHRLCRYVWTDRFEITKFPR